MKKLFSLGLGIAALAGTLSLTSCVGNTLVIYTEAGFAPFEYVKKGKITGVDVEIMEKVGEELGMKVQFENVAFNTIIDAVSQGKMTNVGAAGISVTEERKQKVDFSHEYYQANLYVIYDSSTAPSSKMMTDGNEGVYWSSLNSTKGIGVQTGTTADLFLGDELVEGGSLYGTKKSDFGSLDTAIADIGLNIDYVIIDELPAKKLCEGKENLKCLPLYYEGGEGEDDVLACDSYAICVTKGQDKILNAINKVLDELLEKDENGLTGVQKLVNKHLGV